jgi:hypothetical protein
MRVFRVGCLIAAALVSGSPVLAAQELNWAQKMFSELEHDFGVVARGADVRHRILIRNLYKETVTISGISTSCGCTSATASATTIPTNETVDLIVAMDTLKFMRQKDTHVDVRLTFDGIHIKEVRIPIHAYIRPDVVLEPGVADFGTVGLGAGAQRHIALKYAGRDDWQIREVRSNSTHVQVHAEETGRGNGRVDYRLVVDLSPDAPEGAIRDQLTIITDDATNPYVPVSVTANVEPDIVVATPDVDLGTLTAGVEKTFRVVVRGREPFSIETIECESDRECFRVKLPKEAKSVHVLPITVTPPEAAGPLAEEFTIRVVGRSEPVKFRAAGQVN